MLNSVVYKTSTRQVELNDTLTNANVVFLIEFSSKSSIQAKLIIVAHA